MFLFILLRKTNTRISETDCCWYTELRKRILTVNRSRKKNAKAPKLNRSNYSQQKCIKLRLGANPSQNYVSCKKAASSWACFPHLMWRMPLCPDASGTQVSLLTALFSSALCQGFPYRYRLPTGGSCSWGRGSSLQCLPKPPSATIR